MNLQLGKESWPCSLFEPPPLTAQVCTPVPLRVARHMHSGAMLNYIIVKSIVFPARGSS
jgi:hypothetical protein